jgi:hypothetical protein
VVIVLALTALGSIVLFGLRGAGVESDQTEVTVSATCLFLLEQARLAVLYLSPFLLEVGTVERSCVSRISCD